MTLPHWCDRCGGHATHVYTQKYRTDIKLCALHAADHGPRFVKDGWKEHS